MADIRLITILPPQSVQGVQQPQGAPGAPSHAGTVAGLSSGTVLSGFIVNRDNSGNPVLRTSSGDIVFSSQFFLKIGSEVVIRVDNSPAGTLAHILSVDGQPPEVAVTQSAFSQAPEIIVSQNLAPGQQPPVTTGAAQVPTAPQASAQPAITITGTLVAAPHAPNTAPPLPAGTQLTLKVSSLTAAAPLVPEDILAAAAPETAPAQQPAQSNPAYYSAYARAAATPIPQGTTPPAAASPTTAQTVASAAIPVATIPATTPPASTTPQTDTALIAASQQQPANPPARPALVQIIASPQTVPPVPETAPVAVTTAPANPASPQATPTLPALATPTLQAGQTVMATVLSQQPGGETLVQTPVGVVSLPPQVNLPVGSTITFTVTQIAPPTQDFSPAAVDTLPPAPLTELARQWTSLQQIFGLLSTRDTASGTAFVQSAMPWLAVPATGLAAATAPQSLPVGLLLFMTALQGGDFNNWLGAQNTQWLQSAGHDDLLRRADDEFSSIARQFTEAQPQHWQPLFFPVMVAGELQQGRLFVKRDRKQSTPGREKKSDDTRFVLEVDLSQLGELQMDGFVRKQAKDMQFDLVIRSLAPLPDSMQRDILQIYNDTGQITGYKGTLVFQPVREFPVHPMEEIARARDNVVV